MREAEKGIKTLREMAKKTEDENTLSEILFLLAKTLAAHEKDYKAAVDCYEQVINMKDLKSRPYQIKAKKSSLEGVFTFVRRGLGNTASPGQV